MASSRIGTGFAAKQTYYLLLQSFYSKLLGKEGSRD
jgi:hypothetical protein